MVLWNTKLDKGKKQRAKRKNHRKILFAVKFSCFFALCIKFLLYLEIVDRPAKEGQHTAEADIALGGILILPGAGAGLQEKSNVFP